MGPIAAAAARTALPSSLSSAARADSTQRCGSEAIRSPAAKIRLGAQGGSLGALLLLLLLLPPPLPLLLPPLLLLLLLLRLAKTQSPPSPSGLMCRSSSPSAPHSRSHARSAAVFGSGSGGGAGAGGGCSALRLAARGIGRAVSQTCGWGGYSKRTTDRAGHSAAVAQV